MFVGTVSLQRVIQLSWMTTVSGLAVVAVTMMEMVLAGFSEALRPGRSAYNVLPPGRFDLKSCVRQLARMETWRHV